MWNKSAQHMCGTESSAAVLHSILARCTCRHRCFANSEAVPAEDYKTHMADVWSKRADKYASQVHERAGVMMPLVRHITGLVTQNLQDTDACQALDIASVSICTAG